MMLKIDRIYQMDCLDGIKKIKSNSVKLIIADPPYHQGMTHNGHRGSFVDLAICKPFFKELFEEFDRVLTTDGEVFFFTDWRGYAFYYPLMEAYINVRNLIVWDKISGPGNFYSFTHELIIYGSQSVIMKKGQNIWRTKGFSSGAKKTNGKKVHPTQKPLEIIEKMILEGSKKGDLVLDTFCGSGTTAIAAKKHERHFIGFELDESNFEVLKNRVGQPTQETLFVSL